jgi:hypothetical protein
MQSNQFKYLCLFYLVALLDSFARRMVSDRLFLFTVAAGIAILALSLLGLLYIQAIMIAWSIMMFYLIIRIERKKADVGQTLGISDFAWYSLNEELQAIDRELKNAKDENKAKKLIARRREIERKLREARWGIREDELSSLYSSSKPALIPYKKLDGKKLEKMVRSRLNGIDKECREIMQNEPAQSRGLMIARLSNELRALYWMVKGKENVSPAVADIWVAWCILESARSSKPVESKVITYATEEYREKAFSLASILNVDFESN